MIRFAAIATFVLAAPAIASAQIAPPPGAVTHQGTKAIPSAGPKAMHAKPAHSKSMMMHGAKASPKPKK